MRVIVAGMGVQGHKRRRVAGDECVATVDPVGDGVDYRDIEAVPLESYDAALCCIPDGPKREMLTYLLSNGKHVLVEKPLWTPALSDIDELERLSELNDAVCYTAYNHRFEPHFVGLKALLDDGALGELYSCRMFYGNGTAKLVRDSVWRDEGAGVLPDLGSHLLDTTEFLFGVQREDFSLVAANAFENRAADHVIISAEAARPRIELEMTLLSWRNHFTCDVYGELGSAHVSSLCKWGPSSLTFYSRIMPAGRPPQQTTTLVQDDPTWEAEYHHFKQLIKARSRGNLSTDKWLMQRIDALSGAVIEGASRA
ncbi:MAG: Gfo/Idh/MocA family oxidoreductase [Pseudomonadota bacterium]